MMIAFLIIGLNAEKSEEIILMFSFRHEEQIVVISSLDIFMLILTEIDFADTNSDSLAPPLY